MKIRNSMFYASAFCAAWSFIPQLASAAEAARQPADDLNRVSEIVVTARRAEESLQATPVAVSATSGAELTRRQVLNIFDVKRTAPNVAISTGAPASPTYAVLTIRGQTNMNGGFVNDPAIGLYFDGVYMGRVQGALLDMDDVARAEVLRGPQGTLFGRNTTGGAISIISNQPAPDFGGSVNVRVGDYDLREITGIINVPLIKDELIFRGVIKHTEHSGYGDDPFLSRKLADDDADSWRFALRYAPDGGNWDITLAGDRVHRAGNSQISVLGAVNPAGPAAAFVLANPPAGDTLATYLHSNVSDWWASYNNEPTYYWMTAEGYSATLNAQFGPVKMKSITAWRTLDYNSLVDSDGAPYTILNTTAAVNQEQIQQEFQFSGNIGRLDWIGGFFFFRENGTDSTLSQNLFTGGAAAPFQRNFADILNRSLAGYAQVNYHVTDQLTVTAGLRQTYDKRKAVLYNTRNDAQPREGFANPPFNTVRNCNNGFPNNGTTTFGQNDGPNNPAILCRLTLDTKFHYLSYLASVDYKITDNALLYVKTSRAFLAGGWNSRGGAVAASFAPESVKDVEAGAKVDWLDGRLRTNLAIFHSWQNNVQRTAFVLDPTSGLTTSYLINAGKGHINGAEAEVTAVPWSGMEATASLGLVDARYDKFVDQVDSDPAPGLQPLDRSGEHYPGVPRYTWSVGATQRLPVSFGEWVLHADYAYISSQRYFDATANPLTSAATQAAALGAKAAAIAPGYGLLNGQISLELRHPDVTLALWGRNLTNEKYYTRTFADTYQSFGTAVDYVGDPRTYGASITYRF